MLPFHALLEFYIGAMLACLALAVLLGARSRGPAAVLAVFLGLVGLNFLIYGLYHAQGAPQPLRALAAITLALDPFYLLYFASVYPYRSASRGVRALLAASAVTSAAAAVVVLLHPGRSIYDYPGGNFLPERILLIGNLAFGYAAAWLLAVAKARDAPTPHLRAQAVWTTLALAVVVLPRIAVLHSDFGMLHWWDPTIYVLGPEMTAQRLAVELPAFLVVAAAGWRLARTDGTRRLVVQCAAAAAAIVVLHALLATGILGPGTSSFVFGFRWVIFAAVVVAGLGRGSLFDLRGPPLAVSLFLGASGGLGLAILAAAVLDGQGAPLRAALVGGLMVGLAGAGPAAFAGHALRRRAERRDAGFGGRAALFAVTASRLRDDAAGRRRLLRHRGLFGLDRATADLLERIGPVAWEDPRVGQEILPGIVLEAPLGRGGSGRVFRGRRMDTGRSVVVKVVPVEGGAQAARLLSELEALRGLDHDRVVRLEDAAVGAAGAVLVMADVGGRGLDEALRDGPLPPAAVATLARDVLAALEAAHARGILHRDLKPANVLVTPDHRAHLIDFGLAAGSGATAELPVGSLPYLAPEQACGAPVGVAADLYGCAQVIYEALAGRPALDVAHLPAREALARAADPRIDLRAVPAPWRPVLERALRPDPRRRFPSAAAMRRALDGALAVTPARRGGSVPRSPRRRIAAPRPRPGRPAAS